MEALPSHSGEPAAYPIVAAKLRPPAAPEHVIERPRLHLDVDTVPGFLCSIVAPAGYGKSLAAAQIAYALDPNFCWLTIEDAENDAARFFRYVCAALRVPPSLGNTIAERLRTESSEAAVDLLRVELERTPEPLVLVLDDFHKLTNKNIIEGIAAGVTIPQPLISLICVSRHDPDLPLGRVRAQGRLFEVTTDDLCLTPGETVELEQRAFPDQSLDYLNRKETLTLAEGWATGSYLSAEAIANDHDQDANDRYVGAAAIGRYLRKEVVDHMPAETVQLMMATSIVEQFTPELADALADTTDSHQVLKTLVDDQCFTERVAGPDQAFRYQPMLRQHLLGRLSAEPSDVANRLYDRAAMWFEEQGDLTQAFHWAARGRNIELGKRFMVRSWRIITRPGNVKALRDWAAAVGPAGTDEGLVCIVLAWTALHRRDHDELEQWLTRAQALAAGPTRTTNALSRSIIRAHWSHCAGDIAAMKRHSDDVSEVLESMTADPSSPQGPTAGEELDEEAQIFDALRAGALCTVGMAACLTGDVERGRSILETAIRLARQASHGDTLVNGLCYLAALEAAAGNHSLAAVLADEAIQRYDPAVTRLQGLMLAHIAQSVVALNTGDDELAARSLQPMFAVDVTAEYPVERGLLWGQQARLHHRRGSFDSARDALSEVRRLRRACSVSLLDQETRRLENELRFIADATNDQLPASARELTKRELEIVRSLPGPKSRSELARDLHISENTVKTHLTSISRKLEVRGRAAIVTRAYELDLL